MLNLNGLSFEELEAALAPWGASRTASLKVFAAVYARGARTLDALRGLPQVPARVRDSLLATASLPSLRVIDRRRAADGFVKYLFESPLGGRVEAVRIPIFDTKYVVCVSSQVGCALRCDFCQTGKLGFSRNLRTWEILEQVQVVRAEADRPVRGVVFMGMGEPLLNYVEAVRAARVLSHPAGFAIDSKSITFSTVGWVPAIRRYVEERQPFRLAFSLTSAIPSKRAKVLPIEGTYPLSELVEAIREYSRARKERAMLAYVLIRGFNTGLEDAVALRDLFQGIPIKVDLIDVADPSGEYQPPDEAELKAFRNHLQILRAPIARRYSGGKEIGAACGLLAASQQGGELLSEPRAGEPSVA